MQQNTISDNMSDKLSKVTRQIPVLTTKAKSLDSAKDDLMKGQKDTDLLIPNSQAVAVNKEKPPSKYQQPIHDIPSSIIILTEEEKLELENVLFMHSLQSVGLM